MRFERAFTLLELVFVVLIIGILVGIALPFLSQNKNEAKFLKFRIEYQMLSSALVLMRNEAAFKRLPHPARLDDARPNREGEALFYCKNCAHSLLSAPIFSHKKGWMKVGENRYKFFLGAGQSVDFFYEAGEGFLRCENSSLCKELL